MTDPKVIEAVRKLAMAVKILGNHPSAREDVAVYAQSALSDTNALLAAAEKPAAPATPAKCTECGSRNPTHVDVLDCTDGGGGACCGGDECCVFAKGRNPSGWRRVPLAEVAPAAPAIVPVRFDDNGNARGDKWEASRNSNSSGDVVLFSVLLRPGEDAGEATAKILAAVGRGP